ncbi:LysR substrate binding domain protein [compost metagenome]
MSTLSLVAAGLGVSLVPASLRRVNIEGVVYVNVTGPVALRAGLNLIWRDAPLSGATRKLIDEVRRHRAEGLDEGHSHHVQ